MACTACGKSAIEKSCQCDTTDTMIRFRADLRMVDNTCQLNAVVFDALQSFVEIFADGDDEKRAPEYYHEKPKHVEDLCMNIEAVPFTALLTLEENSYKGKMEVSVKALEQTFSGNGSPTRHPLKPILRSAQASGRTSICPPCAVGDTSFDEGAGVTVVPGGAAQRFRALLTILDKQATTDRTDDASPAVRCSRKVCCSLRAEGDTATYTIFSIGPIGFATRLMSPKKGDSIHAIVSWRNNTDLTLRAFVPLEDNADDAVGFKAFFEKETQLNKDIVSVLKISSQSSPTKRHKEAMDASQELATPEPWTKRNRLSGAP